MLNGKQIQNATVTKDKLSLVDPTSNQDPATKVWTETLVNNSIFMQDWKPSVRAASTGNLNLSSMPSSTDGVTLSNGNRFAAKNQTSGSENGLYVFNGSGVAATRATDADSSSEVTTGMAFYVEEGTTNAKTTWKLVTSGAIVLGTTSLSFEAFSTFQAPVWTLLNKEMAASTTTSDFDQACSNALGGTPANDSYVIVQVNGISVRLGDGVKTKDCYFSADGGTTAKTWANLASGDILRWVGSVAGYQLATSDILDFIFEV